MFIFLFLLQIASASTEDYLLKLDAYLAKTTLEQDFKLNQTAKLVQVSCVTSTFCDTFRKYRKVTNTAPTEVEFTTFSSTWSKLAVEKLTEKSWLEKKGNLVRFIIAYKESFGFKMEITSVQPTKATVTVNNEKKEVGGFVVILKGSNGTQSTEDNVVVTNEILGLGQMVDHTWKNAFFPAGYDRFYLEQIN